MIETIRPVIALAMTVLSISQTADCVDKRKYGLAVKWAFAALSFLAYLHRATVTQ